MVREMCPRCYRVYIREASNTDYIHDCDSGNPVLDNEDVPATLGNYEDTRGAVHKVNTRSQMIKGVADKRFGQKPYPGAESVEDYTSRGKRTSTHITRKHFEFIDKSKNGRS